MFFKQIRQRGDNFSYLIADDTTKEAAVVDPSFNGKEIVRLVQNENLKVRYVINTHDHHDHTADNEEIVSRLGAKVVAHKLSSVSKDIEVADGDTLGSERLLSGLSTRQGTLLMVCACWLMENCLRETLFLSENVAERICLMEARKTCTVASSRS